MCCESEWWEMRGIQNWASSRTRLDSYWERNFRVRRLESERKAISTTDRENCFWITPRHALPMTMHASFFFASPFEELLIYEVACDFHLHVLIFIAASAHVTEHIKHQFIISKCLILPKDFYLCRHHDGLRALLSYCFSRVEHGPSRQWRDKGCSWTIYSRSRWALKSNSRI